MRTSFELHYLGVEAALVEPGRIATAVQSSVDRHSEVYDAIRARDPVRAREATEALLTFISTEVGYAIRRRETPA